MAIPSWLRTSSKKTGTGGTGYKASTSTPTGKTSYSATTKQTYNPYSTKKTQTTTQQTTNQRAKSAETQRLNALAAYYAKKKATTTAFRQADNQSMQQYKQSNAYINQIWKNAQAKATDNPNSEITRWGFTYVPGAGWIQQGTQQAAQNSTENYSTDYGYGGGGGGGGGGGASYETAMPEWYLAMTTWNIAKPNGS